MPKAILQLSLLIIDGYWWYKYTKYNDISLEYYDENTDVSHLPLRTSINGSNDADLFSTYLSCALNPHKSHQTSSTYLRTFIEKME